MSASAFRSDKASRYGSYAVHIDEGDGAAPPALEAGERLGGPPRRRRSRALAKLAMIGIVALAGWAGFTQQVTLLEWSASLATRISSLLERKEPTLLAANARLPQEPPPLPPLETIEPPPSTAVPRSAVAVSTPPPPAAQPADGPDDDPAVPVEKLPPAVADPADPYQVRALAAGLHPGLSRVVLGRLSATDYRNAEIAIKTALAETPDTEVFAYPKKRKAELALFQVKFVRGISPDCRRYVVMVTKDGWLTTAMPMEKCGAGVRQARK